MRASRALLVTCLVCALGALARADEGPKKPEPVPPPPPDATLRISATSLSAGVGYSWGKGTLEYQGKTHAISMDGVLVLAVGISSVSATGSVYGLKSLDDFAGRYEAVRGSSPIGAGGAGVVMRNDKGVEIRMVAEHTGVTLTIGDGPVKLGLER